MLETNPNLDEEDGREECASDRWSLAATAEGDDTEVAEGLGVEGWEDEFLDLRRDVQNIPEIPRPKHVLPPPQTHSPSSLMGLETCARRYYYTHVFPVPYASERIEEAQDYGSAVHAWIEGGMVGDPPRAEGADGNLGTAGGAPRGSARDFRNTEYGLRASSYPLHEGVLPDGDRRGWSKSRSPSRSGAPR